jgi:hypothetical protein
VALVQDRIGTDLEMLIFAEEGKPENPEKNPRSKGENQQQTQLTSHMMHAESGNPANPGHKQNNESY